MPNRRLTPKELNALFASSSFLHEVEESGVDPADVYITATDDQLERWLREGARLQRHTSARAASATSGRPVSWGLWLLASGALWPIAIRLGERFGPQTVDFGSGLIFWSLFLVTTGGLTGILQAFVVKPLLANSTAWVVYTALGWAIGALVAWVLLSFEVYGFLAVVAGDATAAIVFWGAAGGIVGAFQWLALRATVPLASRWIWVCLLGWSVAGIAGRLATGQLTGAVAGAATGWWLSKASRS